MREAELWAFMRLARMILLATCFNGFGRDWPRSNRMTSPRAGKRLERWWRAVTLRRKTEHQVLVTTVARRVGLEEESTLSPK